MPAGPICGRQWPRAIAVTGALGSGKTECVLNMALSFHECGEKITIADVDIINPYFCVRQIAENLRRMGFTILTPKESARWSDMPVISPEVGWALKTEGKRLILDVGGDAVGVRALKQYSEPLEEAGYLLILVVNPFRPQTGDVSGIRNMILNMEKLSGLKIGALAANPHLMDQTTSADLLWGYRQVCDAGKDIGLEVLFGTVPPHLESESDYIGKESPVDLLFMTRHMMLPWEEGYMWTQAGDRS
ncbi:MAG TPA: hypothetical protein PLP89_04370 [Synergistales bacterium]|nr:hypothetical protein [Synergistales bacterium]HRV71405.1 hypothetical protein [Thermovirgaceae bacterium]